MSDQKRRELYAAYSEAGYKIKVYDYPVMQTAGKKRYFRRDRIRFRNRTISELGNPKYVHLFIDSKERLLYIQSCDRDKDAFKLFYRQEKRDEEFYIYAKILMQYLASVIGVAPDSVSLRFGGVLLDEHTVMIALDEYEEVLSE